MTRPKDETPSIPADDPDEDPNETRSYASPPCFMHEVDPAYFGFEAEPPTAHRDTVQAWRRAERKRLREVRRSIPVAERRERSRAIASTLDGLLEGDSHATVGAYWPIDAEPDLRAWMADLVGRGFRVALPVVEERDAPMHFRDWTSDCAMMPGIWDIPVPADGARVVPTCLLAPLVGFDARCFRLGNGGGYFDRTLAAFEPWPLVIGVGYSETAIPTIHPQPHDVPMDVIVTEKGVFGT